VQHLDLQQVAAEDPLPRLLRVLGRLLRGDRAEGEPGEHPHVDEPRVVALHPCHVAVEPTQVLTVEGLQDVEVPDLLHGQHLHAHRADARGDGLGLRPRLGLDQIALGRPGPGRSLDR
jgi:hypothetical protein